MSFYEGSYDYIKEEYDRSYMHLCKLLDRVGEEGLTFRLEAHNRLWYLVGYKGDEHVGTCVISKKNRYQFRELRYWGDMLATMRLSSELPSKVIASSSNSRAIF